MLGYIVVMRVGIEYTKICYFGSKLNILYKSEFIHVYKCVIRRAWITNSLTSNIQKKLYLESKTRELSFIFHIKVNYDTNNRLGNKLLNNN